MHSDFYIGIIFGLSVGLLGMTVVMDATDAVPSDIHKQWEKALIERNLAHYEVGENKTVIFKWNEQQKQ